MTTRPLLAAVAMYLATFGGCASRSANTGFDDVEKLVGERSGRHVHWRKESPADEEIDRRVRSMLESQLDADQAVQIALLSNRDLQATYEDLGVARADLAQAALVHNPVFNADIRLHGDEAGLELALVQDFVDAVLAPLRVRVARAAFEAVKTRVAKAVLDLAGDVGAGFCDLQASQQVGSTKTIEFVADEPGDWAMHCHMTHHLMNQMGHNVPNMIGVDPGDLDDKVRNLLPAYMTMGQAGMADMSEMGMPVPRNSIPMVGGKGPFDYITMGGMFSIFKVREGISSYEDPGWYEHPQGTVAEAAGADELRANGINAGERDG